MKSCGDVSAKMKYVANLLGLWSDGMFVFEKEEDGDALTDYLIYEKDKSGHRLIDQFYLLYTTFCRFGMFLYPVVLVLPFFRK